MADSAEDGAHVPAGAPHFLVHNEGDQVAVAVQDVEPGARLVVYLDSDREVEVQVIEPVPLGHKVALADLAEGVPVIEYRVPVGLASTAVRAGELVHVHNLRSARWASSR
jgi:(2R)-sulfolactate sulfo-lyase subunit alpha